MSVSSAVVAVKSLTNSDDRNMAAALCKKWKQVQEDNYDALFDAMGVPAHKKAIFLANKAFTEISHDGDTWSIKSTVMDNTRVDKFKLGEEKDGVSIVGQPVKFTWNLHGDALVEIARSDGKEIINRRFVQGGQMVSQYKVGQVTATLTFDEA